MKTLFKTKKLIMKTEYKILLKIIVFSILYYLIATFLIGKVFYHLNAAEGGLTAFLDEIRFVKYFYDVFFVGVFIFLVVKLWTISWRKLSGLMKGYVYGLIYLSALFIAYWFS